MFWETSQQRQKFLLFTLGSALGCPLIILGRLWLTSLVDGQGGAIDPRNWGAVYLALANCAIPATLFLVDLMHRHTGHDG